MSRTRPALAACAAACACTALAAPAQAPAVDPGAHAAATTRTVSSPKSGALRFSPKTLSAPRGRIVLRYRNPSSTDHAIALGSKEGRVVTGGGVSRITLNLKKGTYTYYCPVGDHRAEGMRGRLTVR
jgi:plastocyanin